MMLTPFAIAILVASALLVPLSRSVVLGALLQGAALALAGVDAARVLLSGAPLGADLPFASAFLPGALALDSLAAVFVAALVLVGAAVALYAPGYLARAGHRMSPPTQQALLALLEASILGVLVATDVVTFFVAWELMTALATALVLADGHRAEVKRAAILYVVVTHVGTLAALAGLLWLGHGAVAFAALRAAAPAQPAALVLMLVGFGTKAGVVPVHVWLPEAHPVAPSHVSALLSGVILKVGVYGMVRAALDLAGPPAAWVGFALLAVGMASALLGVLYALMQHDLKRLLAFHSVENIGIILLGVGLAICARAAGLPALASVALAAGLFHVVNHAVFKGLLFLCAGSVHLGMHSRDLEEMGGLIRRMPSTARAFLVGALAISALPPLNGFASEWLLLQGFIGSAHAQPGLLRAAAPLLAAGLALTGALAAACFVKAFAVAFLALPRSEHAEHATEAPRSLRLAQNGLAAMCAVLGLGAPWLVPLGGSAGLASTQPLVLFGAGVVLVGAITLFLRRAGRPRPALTWACGQGTVEGRAAYTASAFANPIRRIFANLYRFERETVPVDGVAPYFVMRSRTHGAIAPLFETYLYRPALRTLHWASARLAPWSSPNVNRGLVALALAVAVLLWWAT
jgi:hydrogenase-4 component B